jgi:hypothetical protein
LIPYYLLNIYGSVITNDKIKFLDDRIEIFYENGDRVSYIIDRMEKVKLSVKEHRDKYVFVRVHRKSHGVSEIIIYKNNKKIYFPFIVKDQISTNKLVEIVNNWDSSNFTLYRNAYSY